MKVYELKRNTILEQKVGNKTIFFLFEKCDGAYGIFKEINVRNKEELEQLIQNQKIPNQKIPDEKINGIIFFSCGVFLDSLKLKVYKQPGIIEQTINKIKEVKDSIKDNIKESIKGDTK